MIYEIIYFDIWDSSTYIFQYSAIYACTIYSHLLIHRNTYIFSNKTETIPYYIALLKYFFNTFSFLLTHGFTYKMKCLKNTIPICLKRSTILYRFGQINVHIYSFSRHFYPTRLQLAYIFVYIYILYIPQYIESGNSWCIIQYIVIYYHNAYIIKLQYTENSLIYWPFIYNKIYFLSERDLPFCSGVWSLS